MAGTSQALQWDAAESKIDRFNKPLQPMEATTYGFKGYPDKYMLEPKRPLRHQPSADITADVNRYFRKDSPTEWMPPPNQPPPRMPSPPPAQPQQEPDWLQPSARDQAGQQPAPQIQGTISPRYKDEPQTYRKPPVIRDPLRELTSAEKRKKMDEFYTAEEDLAIARRKREEQKYAKIEEQQKMRYGDENRGMDGVRSSMDMRNGMPERKEEMLEDQSKQLRKMQEEINRLKAQDDLSYRPGDRPSYETNPRAQSGFQVIVAHTSLSPRPLCMSPRPLCVFTSDPDTCEQLNFVGYLFMEEPQTDRPFRRNRDREIFGESQQSLPDYLNISPRRRPVGQLYYKESTYTKDFDPPFVRHGRRNLGNPNKEAYEPFNPFGQEGGGAPMVDAAGQRRTRIAGSMGVLGRELSDSARARRAHKQELLQTIGEQAAYERARKEAEKAYARQGFVEVADVMRQQKVGYPKFKPTGLIDNHHLPHMFNTTPYNELSKQRAYHDYLATQIEEKNRNIRLGQLEEKRQAREHFRTQDNFFGRRGGGNIKGEDLRKVNLDKAIHNPQTSSNYMGGAPYAEGMY